jgi:hypothetical protein
MSGGWRICGVTNLMAISASPFQVCVSTAEYPRTPNYSYSKPFVSAVIFCLGCNVVVYMYLYII